MLVLWVGWRFLSLIANHIFSRPCVTRPAGEPFGTPLRTVNLVFGAMTGVLLPAASSTAIEMVWTPSVSFVVSIELVSATCDGGHARHRRTRTGCRWWG